MITERSCSSWEDFKNYLAVELFDEKPFTTQQFLFRGQGNAEWSLSTSFDRAFAAINDKDRDKIENALYRNFKQEIASQIDPIPDDNVLMALAQHYGLPTRLLDWSESPYIASFFAFQSHFYDSILGKRLSDYIILT
jgi:hypothetical protein